MLIWHNIYAKVECMDLVEKIRIFKRVAELGSFSAASKELKVTQPTVSKAVKAFEKELGVTFLRRTTRGLSLTSEGQKLLFTGGNVLDQVEVMLAAIRNEKLQLQGQLRITTSLAFGRLILAPVLGEFTRLHPDLKLSFHLSDGFVDLVENGIDIAIRIGELRDSTLKALKIGTSRRSLYASPDYVKKFGKPKSIEDLRNHSLLYFTRIRDRPCWPLHTEDGTPTPFYFEPHIQTDGSDLMRELVLKGMGIALLPTWMMCGAVKEKAAIKFFETQSASPTSIYFVTSGTQDMTAKQRAFTDFLVKLFDKIPELSLRQK